MPAASKGNRTQRSAPPSAVTREKEKDRDQGKGARNARHRKNSVARIPESPSDETDSVVYVSPWEAFQEHLRLLDDSSAMYTARDPVKKEGEQGSNEDLKPESSQPLHVETPRDLQSTIKLPSSESFSKVMNEFQMRRQQHLDKLAAIQREREERRAQEEAEGQVQEQPPELEPEPDDEELFDSDWSEEEEEDNLDTRAAATLRKAALRGWGIVRRHIQEITMENKNKGSTMNWSFLRQTLSNMTDMEKGRQNLYERYLYKPDTWTDGLINFPKALLEREDRGRARRGYKPPPLTPNKRRGSYQQPGKSSRNHRMISFKSQS